MEKDEGLNQEGLDFLTSASKDASVPVFISKRLRHIAATNGIDITQDSTALDVFGALKDKAIQAGQWAQEGSRQAKTNQGHTPAEAMQQSSEQDDKASSSVSLTGRVRKWMRHVTSTIQESFENANFSLKMPEPDTQGFVKTARVNMEAFKVKPQILREIPKFSPDYKPMTEAQKEELVQGILNRRAKEGGVEFGGAKIEPIVVGPDGVATPPASRVIEPRRNRTFTR